MLNELITQLLIPAGTLVVGGVAGLLTKSGRVKAKAEAMKAMTEAYEMRIKALHAIIDNHNRTDVENTARIAELNHSLNDKTAQIRKHTERIWEAEQETNRVNAVLIDKEREIADLRVACEYVMEWRCEHPECNDPRGRRPPNGRLRGRRFTVPAIIERYARKDGTPLRMPPPGCGQGKEMTTTL